MRTFSYRLPPFFAFASFLCKCFIFRSDFLSKCGFLMTSRWGFHPNNSSVTMQGLFTTTGRPRHWPLPLATAPLHGGAVPSDISDSASAPIYRQATVPQCSPCPSPPHECWREIFTQNFSALCFYEIGTDKQSVKRAPRGEGRIRTYNLLTAYIGISPIPTVSTLTN